MKSRVDDLIGCRSLPARMMVPLYALRGYCFCHTPSDIKMSLACAFLYLKYFRCMPVHLARVRPAAEYEADFADFFIE